ncbi:MAG: DJ-1/PfpI family protein [Candidatus Heimdallarchaeota archaeon]
MKSYFLFYNGFSGYEMVFPAFILRKTEVITVGLHEGVIKSEETMNYRADMHISELNTDDVDVFIIPGGSSLQHLQDDSVLQKKLNELNQKQKIIAAICGAPVLLANTEALKGKKFTAGGGELPENWQKNFTTGEYVTDELVIDGNLITAKGIACGSFAIAIGKKMGVFEDEEHAQREAEMIMEIR